MDSDTDSTTDVYARNLLTGEFYLANNDRTPAGGDGGNAGCYSPAINADGSIIVFVAEVWNQEVLARNLLTGETHLVSVNTEGTTRRSHQYDNPAIGADGYVVAVTGITEDLIRGDYNSQADVFVAVRAPDTPPLMGDYNNDGVVDSADYVVWRKTKSTMVAPYSAGELQSQVLSMARPMAGFQAM